MDDPRRVEGRIRVLGEKERVIDLYERGMALWSLADHYAVGRKWLGRCLTDWGVVLRGRAEARAVAAARPFPARRERNRGMEPASRVPSGE
jgi:hypothetical protein